MKVVKRVGFAAAALALVLAGCRPPAAGSASEPFTAPGVALRLPKTLYGALSACEPVVKGEFESVCGAAGIAWPPARVTLLAFKRERVLEVWGANHGGLFSRLARYPILAASGKAGPKRRQGDMQVPEGSYRLDALNPASRFHLSLRVSYPNALDVAHASVPRARMGGDIYVHGNAVSAGCIAIGDAAIERVFTLVALARPSERRISISPVDFRAGAAAPDTREEWVRDLYSQLRKELASYSVSPAAARPR